MTAPGRLCEFDVVPVSRRKANSLDGSAAAFGGLLPKVAPGQKLTVIEALQ